METLKELKEFLNGLSEQELNLSLNGNTITLQEEDTMFDADIDFTRAKEDYYRFDLGYGEGIYEASEIRKHCSQEEFDSTVKILTPRFKKGDILIEVNIV